MYVPGETRESHLIIQDSQSTMMLAKFKGKTITCVNGNVSFFDVNVYKISKRVKEVH